MNSLAVLITLLLTATGCADKKPNGDAQKEPSETSKKSEEKRSAGAPGTPEKRKSGDCGRDTACFLASAKTCTAATAKATRVIEIAGKQTQEWEMHIVGPKDGKCDFRRELVGLTLELDDEMKQMMAAAGGAGKLDELQAGAFELIKSKGEHLENCLLDNDALAALLVAEAAGEYNSESYKACLAPEAVCEPLPQLAPQCSAKPCAGGAWPITCVDDKGAKKSCRFNGVTVPNMQLSCGDEGEDSYSFSYVEK